MQATNPNAVHKNAAHFLGSVLRWASNGLICIFPFLKGSPGQTGGESQPKPLTLPQQSHTAIPSISREKVITEPVLAPFSAEKPISHEARLTGVVFESKTEEIKAEIFFRDLQSQSRAIRIKALHQLKELSPMTAAKMLEKLLSAESDVLKIIEALNALAGLGDEAIIPKRLFINYIDHPSPGIRQAALRAVSRYHDDESFAILSARIKDKDPEVRRQTLNCLCWTFAERCTPSVLNSLHDIDISMRKTASQIAGALKIHQAVSGLITLLNDTDTDVQKSASDALKKITGKDFGFKASASKKHKDESIEDWRFWWRDNQTEFLRLPS